MLDTLDDVFDWVSNLQFKGCYNQDLVKISIVMNEGCIIERRAIVDGLEQLGGSQKRSKAPAGYMESQFEQWLTHVQTVLAVEG